MILTRIPKIYTAEIKLENHAVLMLMISMTNKTLISKHGHDFTYDHDFFFSQTS